MTTAPTQAESQRLLLQLLDPANRADPYRLCRQFRDLGPLRLSESNLAVFSAYRDCDEILRHPSSSSDNMKSTVAKRQIEAGLERPRQVPPGFLFLDPPDHTRLRRLVQAAFTRGRIEGLRPRVQAIVHELLDGVAACGPGGRVDLVSTFAFPLPFTVICELLGVPEPDRAPLGQGLTRLLVPTSTAAEYARAKQASDAVVAMLGALAEAKRAAPDDDLICALISARDGDERLDTQELLSTIFQLIVAGHDTTTTLIGNSVVALLCNPGQLAKLQADPGKIPEAIEELLRYDAPVPHSTFRYATEPVPIGGVTIPAGSQVIISLAAANRDRGRYPDADTLDIDRAGVRHLSFGHGIHHCLGATLARMEGQLALGSLLSRFPQLRLAVPPAELRWGHGDGLVLRGLSELPVIPGPATRSQAV